MKEIFFNFFEISRLSRFFDIGILSKYSLYDRFCLLISFPKSENNPSDTSIEVLAKLDNLFINFIFRSGR